MSYTRQRKRIGEKVDSLHAELVGTFMKKARWLQEENRWDEKTESLIESLSGRWARFCHGKPFSPAIRSAFRREVKLCATDQILGHKYGAKTKRVVIMNILLGDATISPEDAALKVLAANKYDVL